MRHELLASVCVLGLSACASEPVEKQSGEAPTLTAAGASAGSVAASGRSGSAPAGRGPESGSAATPARREAEAGRAAVGVNGPPASSGTAGNVAGMGAAGSSAGSAAVSGTGTAGRAADGGITPVFRIPLRVHTAMSELTKAELGPILRELNEIWLGQAGVCFEIEVTASETNREDGFDFRYTSGQIPIARGSNGVFQDAHAIWSIDHPRLSDVTMPVMNPAARTTAHELGHALGLAHENPPPSNDCARPCHCVELGDDCDEYLMRSGMKGFFISKPEIETARSRAPRVALTDQSPAQCGEAVFMD